MTTTKYNEKLNVNGIKILNVTHGVVAFYRNEYKGNKNVDVTIVRKKLSRNRLLARQIKQYENSHGDNITTYLYGQMEITVTNNTVTFLRKIESSLGFYKNLDKYKYFNELLGL